ncbi:MAG: class II glutamine amidotransferase [Gammaproteobacteria bacterium]|nr:class II glutamine amidotransferase [Gammaproteobacteria bacterium]
MCELYGMSSSAPVGIESALLRFRQRGGAEADNPDGWGLAYHDCSGTQPNAFQIVKETTSACGSRLLTRLANKMNTDLLIGHVRKARHPAIVNYLNTHPFMHHCCKKEWVFAHNGLVPSILLADETRLRGTCVPAGLTDSEHAFCHLLDRIAQGFDALLTDPTAWFDSVANRAEWITSLGQFNFLLSDGAHLIAYGHDRLHVLVSGINGTRLVQISTEPLTDEPWQAFRAGELRVYRNGSLLTRAETTPVPVDPQSIAFDAADTAGHQCEV